MKARIVIGANFGDEGKGLVTDYLCSQGAGIVVRFNGGAQAGHTVVAPNGDRHVFHHFGSGTLLGIPTFLSQFFVCNPILLFEELKSLRALGCDPVVYAHPDCLVTTFMDMLINQSIENKRAGKRHGSCGVGFHETINRSSIKELRITMSDLWNGGTRLASQIEEICGKYSKFRCGETFTDDRIKEAFVKGCYEFSEFVNPLGIAQCKDPVFEGAQGLLLDQDNKEFFPHVTHSSTGMKNVNALCAQAGIADKELFYVSRTYLTRHGAGKLPAEDSAMSFADETNKPNPFQGAIRFAPLDPVSLNARCRTDARSTPYKIVLTHCDQLAPTSSGALYSEGETREAISAKPSSVIVV